ncbi:DHH family phosphoesterase [Sedimentibacter hydroxybenzoicus DSM 7310]|uniref:Cyclic-di-AMP phosphodiesterase n=1 Tax=Sedimentibacter hydroxybenzoicus DSM 7310 TaxID=1123245 RepID=A0A974BI15_SEDHY|nr:DHH family phosphoesterase [Sedimentibacter hydroxybenzoicus]NYB73291.1 DHH family phosphoesterase [Sedimentibacter hydroxybenzoicus DSM 7310]
MENKNTPKFLKDDSIIYLTVIIVLIVIFLIEGMYIYAGISSLILMGVAGLALKRQIQREKELKNYIINYTKNIENLSVNSFYYSPLPISIIGPMGKIFWFNNKFKELIDEENENIEFINDFIQNFPLKTLEDYKEGILSNIEIVETGKTFNVMYYKLEEGRFGDSVSYVCYWNENTAFANLKIKYNDERPIVSLIQIDNYDEISEKLDKGEKAAMTAEVEKILNRYASEMNGFVLRYDTSKFLMMFENKFLENLENNKFSMLEEVKCLRGGTDFSFTLSIGTGALAKNLTQHLEYAKGALDVALGRGGDQAVVKRMNSVKFYGGKSKAVEKRTKVKARIISYALRQIIDQSSNVLIMGHRVGDMDSLGASIGLYAIAKSRGKKPYIVLNTINYALKNMYERMKKEDSHYIESVISTEAALNLVDQNTLVVVVDTHRPSYTEAPELLQKVDKIVLIDHHRRSEEYIENALLDYIEPYASSTCELVSEIVQYMEEHIKLTKFEADSLLAGIVVDTNSFTFKTGVRTFEAASFLRRNGADTVDVKELFNESLDSMKKKTEIIERSEIILDDVAVSYIDENSENSNVIAAQSADELLTIKGVKMSFVLVRNEDYINISARSSGTVNVQVIMEYLGGGGHLNMAGAQIPTQDMEEAKNKLYDAISHYKKESNDK